MLEKRGDIGLGIRRRSVAIVIPTYNPGAFLQEAIASVRGQTLKDWRLVVMDDGSTEDLSWVSGLDERVSLVRQENAGQAVARNVAVGIMEAEFIAFLDQDDVWLPTKLERQVSALSADRRAAFCHTQFELIDHDGQPRGRGFGRRQSYLEMLEGSGVCGASTVIVRRDCAIAAGLFDPTLEPAEDYDLWLRLSRNYPGAFVDTVEVRYRLHSRNQSVRYWATHDAMVQILKKHRAAAARRGEQAMARAASRGMQKIRGTYSSQAFDAARVAVKRRDWWHAVSHLGYAASHSPIKLAGWFVNHIVHHAGRRAVGL